MKKILAIFLTVVMVFSMVATAFAATVEVAGKTIFDQKFYADDAGSATALTGVPDGWTLAGTQYSFTEKGIRPTGYYGFTIYNNDAFSAKGGYTFSVTMATYTGANYIHFGASTPADAVYDGVAGTGYTLHAIVDGNTWKSSLYTLYKNGVAIEGLTLTDETVGTSPSVGYRSNRTFSFKVTSAGLTITGPFVGSPLTVADASPVTSGYIGAYIRDNNNTYGNLKSMSLKAEAYSYEIGEDLTKDTGAYAITGQEIIESHEGDIYVNTDFTKATEVPNGVTVKTDSNGAYTLEGNRPGLQFSTVTGTYPNTNVYFASSVETDDDVVIETRFTVKSSQNNTYLYFLGYKLHYKGGYFTLYRLSDGETAETQLGETVASAASSGTLYTLKVEMIDSKINVYLDGEKIMDSIDDATNPSRAGEIRINNSYSYPATIQWAKVYSADYKDTSTYVDIKNTNFLLDKKFSAQDTLASLKAEGYTVTGNSLDYTNDGIYALQNGKVLYSGVEFGGAYTLEILAWKYWQATNIYINCDADFANGYVVSAVHSASTESSVTISKMVGGVSTALELSNGTEFVSMNGANQLYTIKLAPQQNGDLKIAVVIDDKTFEVTDVKTNDNTPYIDGYFGVHQGCWNKDAYIKSFKVYPTSVGNPAYEGAFYVGAEKTDEFAKGNTHFIFPVAMFGQKPVFIAALYEDNVMTDIEFYTVDEINAGAVPMFDTTDSTASETEIIMFVWSSLEGMVNICPPFILD